MTLEPVSIFQRPLAYRLRQKEGHETGGDQALEHVRSQWLAPSMRASEPFHGLIQRTLAALEQAHVRTHDDAFYRALQSLSFQYDQFVRLAVGQLTALPLLPGPLRGILHLQRPNGESPAMQCRALPLSHLERIARTLQLEDKVPDVSLVEPYLFERQQLRSVTNHLMYAQRRDEQPRHAKPHVVHPIEALGDATGVWLHPHSDVGGSDGRLAHHSLLDQMIDRLEHLKLEQSQSPEGADALAKEMIEAPLQWSSVYVSFEDLLEEARLTTSIAPMT